MDVNARRTAWRFITAGALAVCAVAYATTVERAAANPPRSAAPDSALLQRMLDAEDSRATDSASLAPLFVGLASHDSTTRRIAVRAIGRLERRDYTSALDPMLTDPAPAVRAEAVNALTQIARATTANSSWNDESRMQISPRVYARIRGLVASETDPRVRGTIARSLGRLPYPDEEVAEGAAETIASLADGIPSDGALAREPWFGIVHGIDDLLRRLPGLRTAPSVQRIAALPRVPTVANPGSTGSASDAGWSRETNVMLAAIRGRVLGAAVGTQKAVDEATAHSVGARFLSDFGDADPQVRRQVVGLLAVAAAVDEASRARVITAALGDPSFSVRFEAVRAYARRRVAGCAPLITATRDPNAHVALAAIDALATPCDSSGVAVVRLAQLVRELPRAAAARSGTRGSWHAGAHALVALAQAAPDSARASVTRLATHPVWQVRMYATRAAGVLVDTVTLAKLASDTADNVRDAAVNAFAALIRPPRGTNNRAQIERTEKIDSLFTAQLAHTDHQLVLDAAKALEGGRSSTKLADELFASLARLTARQSENARDPRMELMARIETMVEGANRAQRMQPYLSDYDRAIAERAAEILHQWGVGAAAATPRRFKPMPVSLSEMGRLRNARLRVTMAPESGGGSFEMRLLVDDAPASVNRLITLARMGYYNKLTFHRVETNFVIQGGSPGANEYVGADRFMRDEVGLRSHERGTVGISTRGRDTGDAQIFVNLIDNWRLDHDYTVLGEVVRGMEFVDAVLEGDVIARMEIVTGR